MAFHPVRFRMGTAFPPLRKASKAELFLLVSKQKLAKFNPAFPHASEAIWIPSKVE